MSSVIKSEAEMIRDMLAVKRRVEAAKLWTSQENATLGPDTDVLAEPKNKFRYALTNFEEQYVLRPTAHIAAKMHLKRLAGSADDNPERATYARALYAARALQTAIASADDTTTGYPSDINLKTLHGLEADAATTSVILDNIDEGRLLKYEKTIDGFRARIRAKAPSNALIEVRQDTIQTLTGGS